MRKKINLVDSTFSHLTGGLLPEPNKGYSVHAKVSKYIEWVTDGSGEGIFYTDNRIAEVLNDNSDQPKYAWILESESINPYLFDWIRQNLNVCLEKFDMIFTYQTKLLELDPKFKWCSAQGFWIKNPKVYKKSKMISMISSDKNFCEGHRNRLRWVEVLKDQVDFYGAGTKWIDYKEEGLCDYMFSVAIENAQVGGYFTEKLLDCFATGTIPVYLGAPDIGDFFNKDGIIDLSEEFYISEELYYSKMDAVKENLEKTKQYNVLEDFLYLNYLKDVYE
jgi:hypothetical protein